MALNASGTISANSGAAGTNIALEFGWTPPFNLATKTPRGTVPTSAFSLSAFRGQSNFTPVLVVFGVGTGGTTVVPTGTTSMRVVAVGGSGAGGRVQTTALSSGQSGGGGAGKLVDQAMAFTVGQTVTVTIGAGGTSATTPINGGATTVVSATGGTITAAGGTSAPNVIGDQIDGAAGAGGASGQPFSGGVGVAGIGGGQGGGCSAIGSNGETALASNGSTVNIGGSSYYVAEGGPGGGWSRTLTGSRGHGGNGVSRGFSNGSTLGGAGDKGFVAILFS